MEKKFRVILGTIITFIVVAILGTLFLRYWLLNKDELAQKWALEGQVAGLEFGKNHSRQACVDEAVNRAKTCDGILCQTAQTYFIKPCLKAANSSSDICSTMPNNSDEGVGWAKEYCLKIAFQGMGCEIILKEVS